MMNNSWKRVRDPDQKLQTVQQNEDGEHRLMMLEFKAAHKVPGQPLQKLLLVAPYGYNSPTTTNRHKSDAMWKSILKQVNQYKQANKRATVILAGDLNATKLTAIDTNRTLNPEAPMPERVKEKNASVIEAIEAEAGLVDVFRSKHPTVIIKDQLKTKL